MSFAVVTTAAELDRCRAALRGAIDAGTLIGFDVETHGPYIQHHKQKRKRKPDAMRHRIVGFAVTVGADAWYVPLRHGLEYWHDEAGDLGVVESTAQTALHDPHYTSRLRLLRFVSHPKAKVVCHNWGFETQVLANEGVPVRCRRADSLLVAWMRGMRLPGDGGLKLKPLMAHYFNRRRPDFDATVKGRDIRLVPPEELGPYCAADAADAVVLWSRAYGELSEEERRDYWALEEPTIDVALEMQATGVPVDCEALKAGGVRARERMRELRETFRVLTETSVELPTKQRVPKACPACRFRTDTGLSPCTEPGCVQGVLHYKNGNVKQETVEVLMPTRQGADIGSSAQVARWMFDELEWWPAKYHPRSRKSGALSTKAEHIKPYVSLEGQAGEAARMRLEYQGLVKFADLYTDGLITLADQWPDGRLHTSYIQTGTDTGRFSSSFPNISNIPRDGKGTLNVRSAFVAPEGWVCVMRDLSQAELRLLAHFSQDPKLLAVYRDPTGDIHAVTMAGLGIERPEAKVTNFSCIYLITAPSLASKISFFTGKRCHKSKAQEFIDGFMDFYTKVPVYQQRAIRVAEERGYARTIGGFRMPMPAERWAGRLRSHTERQAVNYPIQGSVGTLIKRALVALYREWTERGELGVRVRIQGQTYDEIMVLARKDFAEEANADMQRVMEGAAPELTVPLLSSGGIGTSWATAKT